MNIYIVEGPDGAGKSTLVEALKAADPDIGTVHPGKPPESYEALLGLLNGQFKLQPMKTLIYDRITCISEWVYRPFRIDLVKDPENEVAVYASLMEAQFMLALHLQWPIIYCRPSLETIMRQCTQYTEHDTDETKRVVEEHIEHVVASYDAIMDRLGCFGCRIIHFNYEIDDIDKFITALVES